MKPFDLTPDPKVLVALTHTPLKPLDALSELIDNSIDSFQFAKRTGNEIKHPIVAVSLPSKFEIESGNGCLRIRDNGLGMSLEEAEKALKAGFSGNNPYDSLGLFGMGFNIATGKLGRCTTFITARKQDDFAIRVVIDLMSIKENRSYEVTPEQIKKPDFDQGTMIEVSDWWPEGNANSGFIKKLLAYGKPKVRSEIGRRYASILKKNSVRIVINDESCEAFEHCAWSEGRFLERPKHGKIYAKEHINSTIASQTRCNECFTKFESNSSSCPSCNSSSTRTINEVISGWVGIQRYDDQSHFGIDLIRNGRTIRILEQAAFFEFTDEFGKTIKDYPIDGPYGRIVGEIHLNHVPVDFMKQDFQRSSPEWQRAISFLRGDSSLQPTQPGADQNQSAIFRLYQGYRKVRNIGRKDMYMGTWDAQKGLPKRIDRDTERDFREKFEAKTPGYFDDAEWWKLVEEADTPPIEKFKECPECQADNVQSAEVCCVCDAILKVKPCISCAADIPLSATECQNCGESQLPVFEEPWTCLVCKNINNAQSTNCSECNAVCGTPDPLSKAYLLENSNKDDDLSFSGCSIKLSDGINSPPIDVDTFVVKDKLKIRNSAHELPSITFKSNKIEIFIDKSHQLFTTLSIHPEEVVMTEVANYILVSNGRLSSSKNSEAHALANILWQLLEKFCFDQLADDRDKLVSDIEMFFLDLRTPLITSLDGLYEDIFEELTEIETKHLVANVLQEGLDLSSIAELKKSGFFIKYIGSKTLLRIFTKYPEKLMTGSVFGRVLENVSEIAASVLNEIRSQEISILINCIEDCITFRETSVPDQILQNRTRASLTFLQRSYDS